MNQTDFAALCHATLQQCDQLLITKGGEYAGSEDRLANFKRGAALVGVTPLQCLFVYMSKHYDAVATFIRDNAEGTIRLRSEPIDGRLDDLINYCLLAKALVQESQNANNSSPTQKPVPPGGALPVPLDDRGGSSIRERCGKAAAVFFDNWVASGSDPIRSGPSSWPSLSDECPPRSAPLQRSRELDGPNPQSASAGGVSRNQRDVGKREDSSGALPSFARGGTLSAVAHNRLRQLGALGAGGKVGDKEVAWLRLADGNSLWLEVQGNPDDSPIGGVEGVDVAKSSGSRS